MSALKLRPGEVRFWQEVYLAFMTAPRSWNGFAYEAADLAITRLRERLEDPGPRPDAGRL